MLAASSMIHLAVYSITRMGKQIMALHKSESLTFDIRDEFHRRLTAEKTINLLLSDVEVSPMVIDGKWGTGKTEYCHKLINLLKDTDNNVKCAYIDAFKADHANSPLTTLIAEVANLIDDPGQQSSFIKKAVPAVRYGLKTIGKAGVSWILKQNADEIADEFKDTIKNIGEDGVNAAAELLIKEHQDAEKNLEALREALTQVASEASIIVFIDELDRCKPNFSISIMENIKHVFDVENVQFVLVANFDQLKDSINHCYGLGVDAQRYLDKFVKYTYKLSPIFTTDQHKFTLAAVAHARNMIQEHEALAKSALKSNGYLHLIETLIRTNNLSLREVETFVRYIEIYNVLCKDKGFPEDLVYGYGLLRLLAIYYFCFQAGLCEQIDRGQIDGTKLAQVFGISAHTQHRNYERRDQNMVLAALLFLESTTPVGGLDVANEEDLSEWESDIRRLFNSGGFPPERGERIKIIRQAIQTLRMTR